MFTKRDGHRSFLHVVEGKITRFRSLCFLVAIWQRRVDACSIQYTDTISEYWGAVSFVRSGVCLWTDAGSRSGCTWEDQSGELGSFNRLQSTNGQKRRVLYQEPQIWRSSLDVAYVCICCHVLSSFNELLMLHRLGASTFQHTSALLAFSVPWRLGAMLPKFHYCILLHEWPDGQTWPDCSDGSESHVNVDKTWTTVEHKTQSNLWRSGRFLLPTKARNYVGVRCFL